MLPGSEKRRSKSLDVICKMNTGKNIEKREREREKGGGRKGGEGREIRLLRNERSKYGTGTYVYISQRRSAGGATGANKNVLRTLDITGSNVTRSRRELEFAFRGAERKEMKGGKRRDADSDGAGISTTRYRDY